jgi:hypothetical protein
VTLFGFWTASRTKDVGNKVEERSQEVMTGQSENRETVDKLREKLKKMEAEEESRDLATGSQLYANYKYLEDRAAETGALHDAAKAKEARKIYDEFVKKHLRKS